MQRVWKPPQQDAPKAATGWWEGFGVARQLLTCRSNYAQKVTTQSVRLFLVPSKDLGNFGLRGRLKNN